MVQNIRIFPRVWARHRANIIDWLLRRLFPPCLTIWREVFSYKEVQVKKFCPPVKTKCSPAQNVDRIPDFNVQYVTTKLTDINSTVNSKGPFYFITVYNLSLCNQCRGSWWLTETKVNIQSVTNLNTMSLRQKLLYQLLQLTLPPIFITFCNMYM